VTSGQDPALTVWNLATGEPSIKLPRRHSNWVYAASFSPNGKFLATGSGDNTVRLWTVGPWTDVVLPVGSRSRTFAYSQRVSFADDGALAYGSEDELVRVWLPEKHTVAATVRFETLLRALAFAPDRELIAFQDVSGLKLWQRSIGRVHLLAASSGELDPRTVVALRFSRDSHRLAVGFADGSVACWIVNGAAVRQAWVYHPTETLNRRADKGVRELLFSRSGNELIVALSDGRVQSWKTHTGAMGPLVAAHSAGVTALALSADGRVVLSTSIDGLCKVSTLDGQLLATLITMKEDWLVVSPEGFFDGTTASWKQVPVRFTAEPTRLYEPERFFAVFFEPGLLGAVIRDARPIRDTLRALGDARAEADIERFRRSEPPHVAISAAPADADRTALVTVDAADGGAGVEDCRVMRNGFLAYVHHGAPAGPSRNGTFRVETIIQLAPGPNRLSAYCFNRIGVKSADAIATNPLTGRSVAKPTAFIVSIGIDEYANEDFRLHYAGADADAIATSVGRALQSVGFHVVSVVIKDKNATKDRVLAALSTLVTGPSRATPGDMVVVFFSGHGMSTGDSYYLIPQHLGYAARRSAIDSRGEEQLRQHSISELEMRQLFERIDSDSVILIIDACQSGRALGAGAPRPAPLNAKTLAQLAFDKGMYVVAAAQRDQLAREPETLKHGLLTYALTVEALDRHRAYGTPSEASLTVRQWLDYAVSRVPGLDSEVHRAVDRNVNPIFAPLQGTSEFFQQPLAFYRRLEGSDRTLIARRSTG
jgi:hypothetical protein